MKHILILLATLFFSGSTFSQIDTLWTRCIGGSADEPVGVFEKCQAIVKSMPDSTFLLVTSSPSTDGYIHGNHGTTDVFMARMTLNGDTLWTMNLGGSDIDVATGVDVDANGNIAVCGYTYSTNGTFSGHHGDSLEPDGFIGLFDPDGNKIWAYQYGGSNASGIPGNDYLYDVHFAGNGDIIATGTTSSVNGDLSFILDVFDCGWYLRVNEFGTMNKSSKVYGIDHTYENTNDLYRIIALPNGHFVAVGLQWYFLTANLWLVQFDSYGNKDWEKVYGPAAGDVFTTDFEATTDGGYVVCSYINNHGGDITATYNGGSSDAWVFKTDSAGNIVNQKCFGGSVGELPSRLETYQDRFLMLGATSSHDGYAPGDSLGYTDMWMVYFDNNLDTLFTWRTGGTNIESFISAMLMDNGNMIVAGKTSSNDGSVHGNNGGQDVFVARLIGPALSIWEHIDQQVQVYPNPATEIIRAEVSENDNYTYRIFDISGKLMLQGQYQHAAGMMVDELPAGTYVLTLTSQKHTLGAMFVK